MAAGIARTVSLTQAELRQALEEAKGDDRIAARRLGIRVALFRSLLRTPVRPEPVDDGSVTQTEFLEACNARREERQRERAQKERLRQASTIGNEAAAIAMRGAYGEDGDGFNYHGNPDELVAAAADMLRLRCPENWHAIVAGAWQHLRQALLMEIEEGAPGTSRVRIDPAAAFSEE